ncbi:Very-short-patch-repair endonuclease [Sphingomonas sp. YR710]|uniref:endonuclease domain-containing protein n=1 Tax=Sphingomonas sp. YR710 TaxID=1882773 RepID=UPI00088098AF|nr:DUF559 domain-containing protein [Sphingomonas sp. YR710]SDC35664.1 Very-short-patch-repair endonuclease [Sphingomonas sp. YR710]
MTSAITPHEDARRLNSPPLQGRGRGWGLSANALAENQRRASEMRRNPTEPEKRLWRVLSNGQLDGFKFRRQAVIGGHIADFLCPRKGLVVEVDGDTHADPVAEARRDAALRSHGFTVFRVTNADVMGNIEGVWLQLRDMLRALPDRRAPHPNPSPEGEGLEEAKAQKLLRISLEGSVG